MTKNNNTINPAPYQFDLNSFIENENIETAKRLASPAKAMRQDVIGFVGETCGFLKDEISYQRRSNNRANVANDLDDIVDLAERMSIANAKLLALNP